MDRQLFIDARTGNVCSLLNLPEENNEERELRERLKWTPLHIASLFGQVHFAREFLSRRPQFLQHENPDGCTALHLASSSGHFNMVEFLLSRGHDRVLCMKKDQDGRNPLHHAVIKGSAKVVRKLLEACPESALEVTVHRETVYHLAVKNRVSVSDELFLELLGGPYTEHLLNLADKKGNTVLHLASVRKQSEIIRLLTERRPSLDVNAVNSTGLTPLDLLVVDPINFTDMKIEGIIKSAGGVRLNESQEQREHLKSLASGILVMASLTAAASCQIAVFLKGGFWENSSSAPGGNVTSISNSTSFWVYTSPSANITSIISNTTAAIQKPGNATLHNQHVETEPKSLPYLLASMDGVAFLLSLCLVLLVLFPTSTNKSNIFKWLLLRLLIYATTGSLVMVFLQLVNSRTNLEFQNILPWVFLPFLAVIVMLMLIPLVNIYSSYLMQGLCTRRQYLYRWWNTRGIHHD